MILTSQWLASRSGLVRSAARISEVLELGGRLRALLLDLLSNRTCSRHVSFLVILCRREILELIGVLVFNVSPCSRGEFLPCIHTSPF